MNENNFENGGYPHDNGNSPYGDPFDSNYGNRPPYQPEQKNLPTKGKGFAIAAFVLSVVAFIFFLAGVYELIELGALKLPADEISDSSTLYYVENEDVLRIAAKVLFIMAIIPALVSIVLDIFAYDRHFQNVKNGVKAKYVLVFAIIASVLSVVSLLISIILVF